MKKMPTILFLALYGFGLAGCAQFCPKPPAPITKTVDTACMWAQPIQVSKDDTVETKKAALAAWGAWHRNCDGFQLKATPFKY